MTIYVLEHPEKKQLYNSFVKYFNVFIKIINNNKNKQYNKSNYIWGIYKIII